MDLLIVSVGTVLGLIVLFAIFSYWHVISRLDGQLFFQQHLNGRLMEVERRLDKQEALLETVINCQEHMKIDLYGNGDKGQWGLLQKFDYLEKQIYCMELDEACCVLKRVEDLEDDADRIGAAVKQQENRVDWFVENLKELQRRVDVDEHRHPKELPQNMQKAGWKVTDDPADLFKPTTLTYEEFRKLQGEGFIPEGATPPKEYSGLLDGFSAEWDAVLQQGQVELPKGQTEGVSPKEPNPQLKGSTPNG